MRENKIYKRLIASCVMLLSMVFVILTMFFTNASDESTAIKYKEGYTWKSETYKDANGEGIAPTAPEGYLFAGWYTKEGTIYKAVSNPTEGAEYYAKFVPEKVLGMKAQISKTLTDDNVENDGTTAAIRFVTSIDNSKAYKHVGFNIKKGSSGTAEDAKTTDYVYRTIYAVGATDSNGKAEDYVPEELFHEASYYFKTWTIGNIKEAAYNTEITVIPYWITLDGTRVEGTKAIKVATINLGRSWIYINETANEDGKQYGTKKHPYNDFATALDNIVLAKNGKILLQSDYAESKDFKWNSHGIDITIAGVLGTEKLDFSAVTDMGIGDGVTFANMILKFQGTSSAKGRIHANGNRFEIAADVTSNNQYTTIHGGAYNGDVTETNVTILAGRYRAVYGGCCVGNVKKDTRVTLKNTDIYNTEAHNDSRVNGGCNRGTVGGNTYVTIGTGFNKGMGNAYSQHNHISSVYGGAFSNYDTTIATVKGDTYVVIEDDAKVNYVYGGGYNNSKVEGTCHVEFKGGNVLSIYGGSGGGSGTNSHTSVVMTGGETEQVFGGSYGTDVNGNTNVQLLGGTVTRRIFGGCYNDYDFGWKSSCSVLGNSNVTIGAKANLAIETDTDNSICAVSRYKTNFDTETGVMVLNTGQQESVLGFNMPGVSHELYTNFFVKVDEGGSVAAENGILQIFADIENGYNYATVTYGGKTLGYIKGEGKCSLPELTEETKKSVQDIQVSFSKTEPTVSTEQFVVKNISGENAAYYSSLEEAVEMAEKGTEIVVLNDITVSDTIKITEELTISSEQQVRITRATGVTGNLFDVIGKLTIYGTENGDIIIDGNYVESNAELVRAINVSSGATLNMEYVTIQKFYALNGAAVYCNGTMYGENSTYQFNTTSTAEGGAIYAAANSDVDVIECDFTQNYGYSGGGAIYIAKSGDVYSKNSTFYKNSTQASGTGNGGAIHCKGIYTDDNSKYEENTGRNGGAIALLDKGQAELTGIDANARFINNVSNANGEAIFVNSGNCSVNVSGYIFEGNTGKGAVYVVNGGSAELIDIVFQGETEQTVQVLGTLTFDSITGATLVQGTTGVINVAGYSAGNKLTVTPNKYETDYAVLSKAEKVEDTVFKAACAGITVTEPTNEEDKAYDWWINSTGCLMKGSVRIAVGDKNKYYNTLSQALKYVEDNGATGTADAIVLYVLKNIEISSDITISKNTTIQNESGVDVTISRSSDVVMFAVNSGARFTLGTNDTDEKGTISLDSAKSGSKRMINNKSGATFILGKNATLQNAKNANWGCAMINSGETTLYGNVINNTCTGAGGAILQYSGTLTIKGGTYANNSATREAKGDGSGIGTGNDTASLGGAIRVEAGTVIIEAGKFENNNAKGSGGAIWAKADTTVTITGGNFLNNTADGTSDAIHISSNATATIQDVTFTGEAAQKIYVDGMLTFNNITGATLVQGSAGTLKVAGYNETNELSVTPSRYEVNTVVLTKAEGVDDSVFKAVCAAITVTPDDSGKDWVLNSNGNLVYGVARIGNECYETLNEAITAANTSGGTGETEAVVLYLHKDIEVSEAMIVEKNITIQNQSGTDVQIIRGADFSDGGNMLTVTAGTFSIVGTSDAEIIITGNIEDTSVKARAVTVSAGATFNMKYMTIQKFYIATGAAVSCSGEMTATNSTFTSNRTSNQGGAIYALKGSDVIVTQCYFTENRAGTGGAINIASGGKVTSYTSVFLDNTANGNGGAVNCTGTFIDENSSYTSNTGVKGGALIVMSGGSATLTGTNANAKFSGNVATTDRDDKGSAIYTQVEITVTGYAFEVIENVKSTIHITQNAMFKYKDLQGEYDITGYPDNVSNLATQQ